MTDHEPTAAELAAASWFKSSRSAAQNECVEVAHLSSWVGIRDSKDLSGPVLTFTTSAFTSFIADTMVQRDSTG